MTDFNKQNIFFFSKKFDHLNCGDRVKYYSILLSFNQPVTGIDTSSDVIKNIKAKTNIIKSSRDEKQWLDHINMDNHLNIKDAFFAINEILLNPNTSIAKNFFQYFKNNNKEELFYSLFVCIKSIFNQVRHNYTYTTLRNTALTKFSQSEIKTIDNALVQTIKNYRAVR